MKLEMEYILTLNEAEAFALKKLLGSLTEKQFQDRGITGEDRQYMNEIC